MWGLLEVSRGRGGPARGDRGGGAGAGGGGCGDAGPAGHLPAGGGARGGEGPLPEHHRNSAQPQAGAGQLREALLHIRRGRGE